LISVWIKPVPISAAGKDRVRLVLAASGLAVVLIPAIIASVILIPGQNRINWKWARFAIVTAFFVVHCVRSYWRARGHLRFWAILFAVLIIHFLGVGYFYYAGPGLLPLLVFVPIVAVEWGILAVVVYKVLGIGPPARKRRISSPR
jgi:hypothetical protein